MGDNSLIEDLERYRRNNVELAMALNDLKTELNIVQMQLLEKNRELQTVYDDNATLKQNIAQKDGQLSTWRALIVDLVTTNTRKYTEMMQKVGLVPPANGTSNKSIKTDNGTPKLASTEQPNANNNVRVNVNRRQRQEYDDSSPKLADLTEESVYSQFNDTKSLTPSPEQKTAHVTSRRRASIPPMTPASPLREIQERMVVSGESKGKKSSAKVQKMEKIVDENTHACETNGTVGRKTQRKAAPKSLAEPKLGTKLRRN